ncbi:MAG: response regulator [Thermodesulfobacteriota bacterium]|nr:response regulator [Thermodesulfobacteriota bacterium]
MKKSPLILIIDDNPNNVKLLEIILKKEGYSTMSALNGPDGRKLAEMHDPDLILLDIMMPNEDGFEACTRLLSAEKTAGIPVIFLSAADDVVSKVKGLTIGAVDYITKPFDRREVFARIRIHLRLKQAYNAVIEGQAAKLRQIGEAQNGILIKPEDLPNASFGVLYMPVLDAGGDFYSVFNIGDGIYGYFVADISGHDIGTSFVTSALNALLKQNANTIYTPVETMKMLNDVLRKILKNGQHITACYVYLNRLKSTLTVVSAGHPPVIYMKKNGKIELLQGKGDILGTFESAIFNPVTIKVSGGDRFFLYSDGIIEGFDGNKKTRSQGIKELSDACFDTRQISVKQAIAKIKTSFFPENTNPQDDIVLLGVEV